MLAGSTLFLDLDGTLLDLCDRPDMVRADSDMQSLLCALCTSLDGRIAIVSGRSLQQIDNILGECAADLAVSGSHGCEHRWNGILARPQRPDSLDYAVQRANEFAQDRPGVIVEEKSFGVGLHYRLNPSAEPEAAALAAALSRELGLELQPGKMMYELRVPGGDKGGAVRRLMAREAMQATKPLFFGDDVTDEAGFTAARELGGHGILVGPHRPTAAEFALASPTALRDWLWAALS